MSHNQSSLDLEARWGNHLWSSERGRRAAKTLVESRGWIDWFATLADAKRTPQGVQPARVKRRPYATRAGHLIVMLVDTSASTLRHQGLAMAKGAVQGVLKRAYSERQRVALIRFGGSQAQLIYTPARAPQNPDKYLQALAAGGGTPLRLGLDTAIRLLKRERRSRPDEPQTLVILTDGRSRDPLDGLTLPCPSILIDIEGGAIRLGRCAQLAKTLGARYIPVCALPELERPHPQNPSHSRCA